MGVCVCVCACMRACVCVCMCVWFIFYEIQDFGQELQNSNFSNGKHFFLFIDKFLKFDKIEYLSYCTKFEMWPVLFYVNSTSYFQNWNINYVVTFLNSSKDSKLKFFNVGLKLYFQFFPNSQWDGIFECCSSWTSQFFPIHDRYGKLRSLNVSPNCTSKYFPTH